MALFVSFSQAGAGYRQSSRWSTSKQPEEAYALTRVGGTQQQGACNEASGGH